MHVAVPDEIFAAVRANSCKRETLELTLTVAAYNMMSRVLVPLEVQRGESPFADG